MLQRKRLELARALATQPRLLLLDEIAGGLIEAEVDELIETIRELRSSGITIVWIEHVVHALLSVVDRLVAIDFGRVLTEGVPAEVIASPEVQAVYMGVEDRVSLLEVEALDQFYGDLQALFGISLHVDEGEIVAVIGANGAGKSTLLRTVAGVLPTSSGSVRFDGRSIVDLPAYDRVPQGISMVPEGRRIFPSLSVQENLMIGAFGRRPGAWSLARVYELFPLLTRLAKRPRRGPVRRRTADARDRQGADGQPAPALDG